MPRPKAKNTKFPPNMKALSILASVLLISTGFLSTLNYYNASTNLPQRNAKAQEVNPSQGDGGGIGTPGGQVSSSSSSVSSSISSSVISSSSSISSSIISSSSSISSSISSSVISSSSSISSSVSSSVIGGTIQNGLNSSTPSGLQNEGGGAIGRSRGNVIVTDTVPTGSSSSVTNSSSSIVFTQTNTPRTGGLEVTFTVLALAAMAYFVYYYKYHGDKKSKLAMAEKRIDVKRR